MDWQALGLTISPLLALIGYIHMRLNVVEKGIRMSVSENEVKDLISLKLESIQVMQSITDKRLDRLEEALCRLSDKIDQLMLK